MELIEDRGPVMRGEVRAYVFEGDIDPVRVANDTGDEAWSRLVSEYATANLVTNLGRAQMTKILVGESTAVLLYMALSTSIIVPAFTDTVTTIPDRIITQPLSIKQSYLTYYQRYVSFFSTVSFASTGISTEALLDASSTASTTNLWADAAITVSKSATQSLLVDHRIQATTG